MLRVLAHWLATENPRQREWEKIRLVKARFHPHRVPHGRSPSAGEVTGYAHSLREASVAYRDFVTDSSRSFAVYGPDAVEIGSESCAPLRDRQAPDRWSPGRRA